MTNITKLADMGKLVLAGLRRLENGIEGMVLICGCDGDSWNPLQKPKAKKRILAKGRSVLGQDSDLRRRKL